MSPTKNRLALATIVTGLALQAFYYLSNIVISLGSNIEVIFLAEAVLSFIYVLGILLFTLGIVMIIASRFDGWNGWALILKSTALITLFVSFLVLAVAFYAIILTMPEGLWGTYQGNYVAWSFTPYGSIVSWLSYLTLFLLAYVLIFKEREIRMQ